MKLNCIIIRYHKTVCAHSIKGHHRYNSTSLEFHFLDFCELSLCIIATSELSDHRCSGVQAGALQSCEDKFSSHNQDIRADDHTSI